jgi:hypothetical protein
LGVLVSLPLIVQAEDAAAPESGKTSQQTAPAPAPSANSINDILNLDITQLGQVSVKSTVQPTNLSAPSTQLNVAAADIGEANSIGELLRQVPSVNTRRLSGINFDPQVRGYNSSQLNATANGMNQLKTRVDIDSLFSQIDPGIVRDITVIDGPYTSLYGPGFAFLSADLMSPPRFSTPQTHFSTNFVYGTNGQSLYSRDNVVTGAQNWGVFCSYGLREANDYQTGGVSGQSFTAPSSYQKWDGMFSVSRDLNDYSRIEFDYLRTGRGLRSEQLGQQSIQYSVYHSGRPQRAATTLGASVAPGDILRRRLQPTVQTRDFLPRLHLGDLCVVERARSRACNHRGRRIRDLDGHSHAANLR